MEDALSTHPGKTQQPGSRHTPRLFSKSGAHDAWQSQAAGHASCESPAGFLRHELAWQKNLNAWRTAAEVWPPDEHQRQTELEALLG